MKTFLLIGVVAAFMNVSGEVRPDFLFQDGLVVSAKKPFVVKGTATPSRRVTVSLLGKTYAATSGADGRFAVEVAALPVVKEPFEIVVDDGDSKAVVSNCLSGLVLLAGGQSNMEVPIDETADWEAEVAKAKRPSIREFKVEHDFAFEPQATLKGAWTAVTPATAAKIGAVAYFTAEYLQDALDGVPVGIINNSWSATPIQPWLPFEILDADSRFRRHALHEYNKYKHLGHDGLIAYREEMGRSLFVADTENAGEAKGWNRGPGSDWRDCKVPGWLEETWGETEGAFWFAREVELPTSFVGKDLEFRCSCMDDYDTTYFNGTKIGSTGEETPNAYDMPRGYRIPAALVTGTKATVSVRIFDSAHAGGIPGKDVQIVCGEEVVDITGTWKTQVERKIAPVKWPADYLPLVKVYRFGSVLYNAMVHPLKGTPVDAMLWYQGESNAGGREYAEYFEHLIRRWRADFGCGDVPFVFVQLAAFTQPPKDAADDGSWPVTREQQELALALPNVRMTPAIDIGDANRIHPLNKREVGRRNALWLLQDFFKPDAFRNAIGFPAVKSVTAADGRFVVALEQADGLKTTDGKPPACFVVEGPKPPRGKSPCAYAEAEIRGSEIVVTPPADFGEIVALRYAWHMNPPVNVVNGRGFPMLPFRRYVKQVTRTVRLDTLNLDSMTTGSDPVQRNKNNCGKPLKIGKRGYGFGVGTHAPSRYELEVRGEAIAFKAFVGVDTSIKTADKGSVTFGIYGDGRLLAETPVLKFGDDPYELKADLRGVRRIVLCVGDAGDTNFNDLADWCEAAFTLEGDSYVIPKVYPPEREQFGILSPVPSPAAKINPPSVYGVRPNHPILFTLPVSGERPLACSVTGLPDGVSFDPATRILSGAVAARGTYPLVFTAENRHGKDVSTLSLVVGDAIALTPPMGWNSWNCFASAVTRKDIESAADAFIDSGLADYGWRYVNVDDFWATYQKPNGKFNDIRGAARLPDGTIAVNSRFADMKALADYVHAKGLKIGLYSSPGPTTCGGCAGSWEHEEQDAATFAAWGYDYLKYDWCSYESVAKVGGVADRRLPYEKMGEALARQDRDIVHSICQYGLANVSSWGKSVKGQLWRTTGDIVDTWSSLRGIVRQQVGLERFAGPDGWNDPDMLIVGQVGWGPSLHPTRLTPNEQYAHLTWWSLFAAPLLIGCDLTKLDDFTRALLTNPEVIEVDQDPLGKAAARIVGNDADLGCEVWMRPLSDGSYAVGIFNVSSERRTVEVTLAQLGLKGAWACRDLWRRADLPDVTEKLETTLPSHAPLFVRLTPRR